MMGFTFIKDYLFKCDTCGKEVPSGITNLANHWAECYGKDTIDNLHKIDNMPLRIKDKMDLFKQLFKIEQ